MATQRAPSPRFREDDAVAGIRLQPDDLDILWHVYCTRVIDTQSLQLLFPNRSAQVISRRLNLLRKGSDPYLRRLPQAQNRLHLRNGSDPFAYALARRGAEALRSLRGHDIPAQRWTQKNRELRPSMIDHALATSRFLAQMRANVTAGNDGRQFHYQEEFSWLPRRMTSSAGLRNTIRATVDWHGYRGEEGTAPDAVFAISRSDGDGKRRYAYFLLEIDRGTETIVPSKQRLTSNSFWRSSSLLRKYIVYAAAHRQKAHQTLWGILVYRVLTATTTADRLGKVQAACRMYLPDVKPGQFIFSTCTTEGAPLLKNLVDIVNNCVEV